MKFIFPQNYNFKSKILGWIDYNTAILDVIWGVLVFGLVNLFNQSLSLKIFFFVIFFFPVFLLSIVGFNGENIINMMAYLIKYIVRPKVILYKKVIYFKDKR